MTQYILWYNSCRKTNYKRQGTLHLVGLNSIILLLLSSCCFFSFFLCPVVYHVCAARTVGVRLLSPHSDTELFPPTVFLTFLLHYLFARKYTLDTATGCEFFFSLLTVRKLLFCWLMPWWTFTKMSWIAFYCGIKEHLGFFRCLIFIFIFLPAETSKISHENVDEKLGINSV